jgi:hypothetical protein
MNRFSSMPIRLANAEGLGGLRVSGSGDSVGHLSA